MPHQCTNCGRTFADGSKEMLSGCPDCGGNKFQFRPASASEPTQSDTVSPSDSPSDSIPDESSPVNTSNADQADTSPRQSDTTQPSKDAHSPETSTTQPPKSDAERDTGSWPDPATESDTDDPTDEGGLTDAAARAGAAVRDRFSRKSDDDASTSDASQTTDSLSTTDSPHSTDPDADSDTAVEDSAQTTARSDVVSREELSAAARDVDSDRSQTPPDSEPPSATAEDTVADAPSRDDQPDLSELREELNDQFESIKIVSQGQYELNLMELYDRDEYIISLQEDGRYVIEVPDRWRENE